MVRRMNVEHCGSSELDGVETIVTQCSGGFAFYCLSTRSRRGFGRIGRQRRQAVEREQQVVSLVKDVEMSLNGAVGGGNEDCGVMRLAKCNVGEKTRAAAGLFGDVGAIGGGDVHPSQADAGG